MFLGHLHNHKVNLKKEELVMLIAPSNVGKKIIVKVSFVGDDTKYT